MLGPATRLLWRSPEEIQLEMGSNSVLVDGLPVDLVRRTASRQLPPAENDDDVRDGDPEVRDALRTLGEAGLLWPRASAADDERLHPPVPRLAGELAALAVRHGPAAAQVLRSRRTATVEVHGLSRTAVHLASLLASAGVQRVRCIGAGDVGLGHAAPGGLLPGDEGRPRVAGADDALRRAAPDVDLTPLPPDRGPDLTVLALDAPLSDDHRNALHAAGTPHLSVTLGVGHGVVGPLVLPGITSCLHCADLLRQDRDPAWQTLSLQLATPQRYGAMSAVAISSVVVGIAGLQALAFLDGDEPAALSGTLEIHPPDWRVRRRTWPVHPDCDCSWGDHAREVAPPSQVRGPRR